MTDDLWQRIAKTAEECGTLAPNALADAILTVVQPELIRLRKDMQLWCDAVASAEKLRQYQAADADRYEAQLREERDVAVTAIDRVRALHKKEPDAGYCDVCANHGDTTWPCATIAALDGPAQQPLCAECDHPQDEHEDADEPVSVGLCKTCDAKDSDEAWHDYEPRQEFGGGR